MIGLTSYLLQKCFFDLDWDPNVSPLWISFFCRPLPLSRWMAPSLTWFCCTVLLDKGVHWPHTCMCWWLMPWAMSETAKIQGKIKQISLSGGTEMVNNHFAEDSTTFVHADQTFVETVRECLNCIYRCFWCSCEWSKNRVWVVGVGWPIGLDPSWLELYLTWGNCLLFWDSI